MSTQLKKEIENIDFDLSEISSLDLMAKRPNVKTLLTAETTRLQQKKSQLLSQLKELLAKEEPNKADGQTTGSAGQPPMGTVIVTNYMWDQTNDFVKVYIEIDKNDSLDSTQIQMSFQSRRSVAIIFGKYKFTISKLFDDIDTEKSYNKVTKSGKQLIIYLKKVSLKQWTSINETENKFKKAMEEEKEDLNADPSAGLMKLMKQMYDEGDDDMKRTIAKSWYESRNKNSTDVDMKADNMNI